MTSFLSEYGSCLRESRAGRGGGAAWDHGEAGTLPGVRSISYVGTKNICIFYSF